MAAATGRPAPQPLHPYDVNTNRQYGWVSLWGWVTTLLLAAQPRDTTFATAHTLAAVVDKDYNYKSVQTLNSLLRYIKSVTPMF